MAKLIGKGAKRLTIEDAQLDAFKNTGWVEYNADGTPLAIKKEDGCDHGVKVAELAKELEGAKGALETAELAVETAKADKEAAEKVLEELLAVLKAKDVADFKTKANAIVELAKANKAKEDADAKKPADKPADTPAPADKPAEQKTA